MERSKIYSILGKFTKNELTEFRKFLISPYFNKSRNVKNLFDLLQPHHPDFTSRVLDKDILHSKIFPKSKFSSRSIDNLNTKLRKLCELFISINSFKSSTPDMDLMLLNQYRKRKMDSLLANKLNSLTGAYNPDMHYSTEQYHYFYYLNFLKTDLNFSKIHFEKEEKILGDLSTDYVLFREYSYRHKIRLLVRLAIIQFVTGQSRELSPEFIKLLNEILDSRDIKEHSEKQIYSKVAQNLLNHTRFDYFKLKKELLKTQNIISNEDFDLILTLLVLYFFYPIDETDQNLVRERFEHVRLMIERKVWNVVDGNMKEKNFSFAVNAAIKAGELDWAENFIKYYSIYVIKEQRNDAINYNMALLYFTKAGTEKFNREEFYNKAFDYLSHFRIRDYTNKLQVYLLRTMLFFDTQQYSGVYSECLAFEQYLLHNKEYINSQVAGSYIVYNKYLKYLTNYIIDEDLLKIQKLIEKLIKEKPFINKVWLMERVSNNIRKVKT